MLNIATHKTILLQILKQIFSDTTIGPVLGFKDGTAACFFYNLSRFSVDLDFDLLDGTKTDYVFQRIEKILSEFGKIRESYKKKHTLFFVLSYDDGARNIKVEISSRNFGSCYELRNYLGISMQVMVREDMFAHKLVAMTERLGRTNRDIFDVWFFLKNNWPINKEIVEKRSGIPFGDFLQKCIDSIDKMSDRNILAGMGDILDDKNKVWVKTNLRKDTIFLLKTRMEGEGKK